MKGGNSQVNLQLNQSFMRSRTVDKSEALVTRQLQRILDLVRFFWENDGNLVLLGLEHSNYHAKEVPARNLHGIGAFEFQVEDIGL